MLGLLLMLATFSGGSWLCYQGSFGQMKHQWLAALSIFVGLPLTATLVCIEAAWVLQ